MYTFSIQVDVLTTAEDSFQAIANLMNRGHYMPDGVTNLRQTMPRPPSETDKFLPGERAAYSFGGSIIETEITEVEEFDQAESNVYESVVRSPKAEKLHWRISELMPGTMRVTLTFLAEYGGLEKVSKGGTAKKFWQETLDRLVKHLEDKRSFAGARTFAPTTQTKGWDDPLANF